MPKIGDALKRAVETRPEQPEPKDGRAKPSSSLMNDNRRGIFKFLCMNPCSSAGQISKALGLSNPSVKWHLSALEQADYVKSTMAEGRPIYCPLGLVSMDAMPFFALLAKTGSAAIYGAIEKSAGSSHGSIVSATALSTALVRDRLNAFLSMGLVTLVKDGRNARYFPTSKLDEIMAGERKTRREFQRNLIARLSAEHLDPEIGEFKGSGVIIYITALGQKDSINIPNEVP